MHAPRAARKGQLSHETSTQQSSGTCFSRLRHKIPRSMQPLLLLPLLLLLASPTPSHAQSLVVPCSACSSCSGSGCSGCQQVLQSPCPNAAGWCSGCSNCNSSSCTTCNAPGFSLGCTYDDWYNSRQNEYAFISFIFIAFIVVLVAWLFFTLCQRHKEKQRREQLQQQAGGGDAPAQEMSMANSFNPHYSMNPADPNQPAGQAPSPAQEPYHYYYASTSLPTPSQQPPTAYPAPPPGYPGTPGSAYYPSQPPIASALAPPPAAFTRNDELTPAPPLPVSDPLPSPPPPRSGRRADDHRQSLLSQEQRGGNSSSII